MSIINPDLSWLKALQRFQSTKNLSLSLFKISSLEKYVFLSSVLPKRCSLINWATYPEFKTYNMEMQTEDKPYSCVKCNLSFKMAIDLKMHMVQHGGKKTHSCNQCGYSTIKAGHLKMHMMVHSGEKPFVCKQCNYSSADASKLKRHMQTHSGEKPFLQTVQLVLHNSWSPQDTHDDAFRGEAFQVWPV